VSDDQSDRLVDALAGGCMVAGTSALAASVEEVKVEVEEVGVVRVEEVMGARVAESREQDAQQPCTPGAGPTQQWPRTARECGTLLCH